MLVDCREERSLLRRYTKPNQAIEIPEVCTGDESQGFQAVPTFVGSMIARKIGQELSLSCFSWRKNAHTCQSLLCL